MICKCPLRTADLHRLEIMKGRQMKRYLRAAEKDDKLTMEDALQAIEQLRTNLNYLTN